MISNLQIQDTDSNVRWEKQLTDEDYKLVENHLKGEKIVGIFSATFKPVRTNNLKNFSKDFFLPTTLNHAIRAHCFVSKFFAIPSSVILDFLTFPVRIWNCRSRIISNANRNEISFHRYLIDEGVDSKLLKSGSVRIRLEWAKTIETTNPMSLASKSIQKLYWLEGSINFIELPYQAQVINRGCVWDV